MQSFVRALLEIDCREWEGTDVFPAHGRLRGCMRTSAVRRGFLPKLWSFLDSPYMYVQSHLIC
jgi:hypothetical protein